MGDITLADFWQYRARTFSSRGSEKGVNLVLINSGIGQKLFDSVRNELVTEVHTWQEAHISNKQLSEPNKMPGRYDSFWKDYFDGGFAKVMEKYYLPDRKTERKMRLVVWKRAHEYLMPRPFKK